MRVVLKNRNLTQFYFANSKFICNFIREMRCFIRSKKQTMLIFTNIHNKEWLRKLKNYCSNLLYSLELFLGKLFVVSFFYRYSHNTNNPAHKRVAENPRGTFKSTYVNTKNNCIHVLCKNNWSNFSSRHSYLHSFVGEGSDK